MSIPITISISCTAPDVHGGEVCGAIVSGLVGPDAPDSERWETLWHYMQGGPGVFKGDLYFYKLDGDIRGRVAQIDTRRCPLFLLSGEYDYSCTPEETLAVANSIPGSEVTIMKGLGHFPMSEDPQAFLAHLLPVLEKIGQELKVPRITANARTWCGRDVGLQERRRYLPTRGEPAFAQRGVDLGHGGAAIGLALPVEPLLMGAEIGDPGLDLGNLRLEAAAQVGPRDRLHHAPFAGVSCGAGFGRSSGLGHQRLDVRHRR